MTTGSHTTFLKKTALRLCWGLCMSGGQTKKYKTRGERIFRNVWGKIVSHLHRFGVLTLSFSVVGLDYKHSSQVSRNPTIQAEPHLINIVVLSLGFVLLGYFFFPPNVYTRVMAHFSVPLNVCSVCRIHQPKQSLFQQQPQSAQLTELPSIKCIWNSLSLWTLIFPPEVYSSS